MPYVRPAALVASLVGTLVRNQRRTLEPRSRAAVRRGEKTATTGHLTQVGHASGTVTPARSCTPTRSCTRRVSGPTPPPWISGCADQHPDLAGGFADHTVELPNPTCTLP